MFLLSSKNPPPLSTPPLPSPLSSSLPLSCLPLPLPHSWVILPSSRYLILQEFSGENIRFWAACEAYKNLEAAKRNGLSLKPLPLGTFTKVFIRCGLENSS